jgi:hypothetical protein
MRRSFVPWLEILEDRTLPSTLMVTNTNDKGPGSLRHTITNAKSGDSIVFAPSLDGQTITLTRGQLAVSKNLDIEGLGAGQLTISGNAASRIFDISSGVSLTLAGLTLSNGLAVKGGAILDEAGAGLALSHVVLSNNQAVGGLGGGAIFNDVGASLSISDSSLTSNAAITTVQFNPTTGSGGGGAIFNETGASLSVTNSELTDNQALTTEGFDVCGGAIYSLGAHTTATIINSTLANNQVTGGGSSTILAGSLGGAVANSLGAALTVNDCTFADNQAVSASDDNIVSAYVGSGGALENDLGSSATVLGSQFLRNRAIGGDSQSGQGGAIANYGTTATRFRTLACV